MNKEMSDPYVDSIVRMGRALAKETRVLSIIDKIRAQSWDNFNFYKAVRQTEIDFPEVCGSSNWDTFIIKESALRSIPC